MNLRERCKIATDANDRVGAWACCECARRHLAALTSAGGLVPCVCGHRCCVRPDPAPAPDIVTVGLRLVDLLFRSPPSRPKKPRPKKPRPRTQRRDET